MDEDRYIPLRPTIEDRQERVLDLVECLEEHAHEAARDMQNMQVTLLRLFEMSNKKIAALSEKTEQS